MTPPGLALISVSPAAVEASTNATSPRFYFDWAATLESQHEDPPVNPFTPAIPAVLGLDVAVSLLLEEGLEAVFERHIRLGRAARAGVKALGLELFSPDDDTSAVVTAVRMPAEIDAGEVIADLFTRFGITMEGGRKELTGKIVRIGHVGYVDVFDVTIQLAALELVLSEAGADIERGLAVTAALEAFEGVRV
jgi:aspartate aminotransferase-like enzyme